jgi:hypothetical protein
MITLMMEVVRASETSAYSNGTNRPYIPEGSNLHTLLRENLKSHMVLHLLQEEESEP